MKRVLLSAVLIASCVFSAAQVPEYINYQAIVRNTAGQPLVTQDVIFLFSIIKTTTGGTVVYTEKHTVETNQFGLVTLAIGNGTDKTGNFTTIDWGADVYFLNVQVDKGDAIFMDMGTTQLLSVPYAMYSKKAGAANETDPVFGAWNKTTGINITADQISDFQTSVTNNAAVLLNTAKVTNATHTGDVTGSEALTIANKVTMTGTAPVSITGNPTVIATNPVAISIAAATTSAAGSMSAADKAKLDGIATSSYYLGQSKDGGIIFNIYKGSDGLEHGLIVALTESSAQWQNPSSLVNADRSWDGAYNTNLMTNSPAKTYVTGLGEGWYLPSIDELSILWHNRFYVNTALFNGGNTLLSTNYWSSTEFNAGVAWPFTFYYGTPSADNSKTLTYSVRAIRAF